MKPDLPQPKAGDGVVFCLHLIVDGIPQLRGSHVQQILPGQTLSPGELPHEWLVVCRKCKARRVADPHAPIAGICYDWPAGARFQYGDAS